MNNGENIYGLTSLVINLAFVIFFIVTGWKIFTKAGKPGWAIIIPIYNIYIMLKIAGKPGWWLLLFFIPLVNIVISILLALGMAKAFGKSQTFGIFGLWLFSFVGYPILAFGNAQYIGTENPVQSQPVSVQQPPQQVTP